MKHRIMALATACALPLAALAQTPAIDTFFDAMAIAVAPGQQAQYVAGDNVAGYFEGYTHAPNRGAGYVIRNETVFKGYQVEGSDGGGREQVLPYGHRIVHANGMTQDMALLSKQQAIAIRIRARSAKLLAMQALLPEHGPASRMLGDAQVLPPAPGKSLYTAIAAGVPVSFTGSGALRSKQTHTQVTVVLAFAATAEQAAKQAAALAASDAIGDERRARYQALTTSRLVTSDANYNKALNWAKAASQMFVVEEFGTGIWAGLPWFRDNWGRDTFIALPGTLLVTGQFGDARAVLQNFARYQNLHADAL